VVRDLIFIPFDDLNKHAITYLNLLLTASSKARGELSDLLYYTLSVPKELAHFFSVHIHSDDNEYINTYD
jgi:hypothetical protein